jgi:CxxC-x17-CxxC domain-containing protein
VNDVIYFNPADLDFPIAFNVFEKVGRELQHLVASGLIGIFKKLWADSWGPRLEYVLRNAILALLEYPDSTLLGVMRLLVDKGYRKKVTSAISDPVVRSFWVDEYSKYPDKFQSEAIAPIQNKVGQFLSSPVIRNIVGQTRSSFSLREAMDQGKVLLFNLAKGRVGEDNSALLGAMLINKIQMAAMYRVDTPEPERRDFYLYVDEFQNFETESFANILSEARKYRLNLIIAHQYIEQLEEEVAAAVFGNVGTLICFRVGATDGEMLEKEFDPYFLLVDLVNLAKYDVYMKLMIDGVSSQPFSATTLPPWGGEVNNRDKIVKVSRERYATPREVLEEKISRWSAADHSVDAPGGDSAPKSALTRPSLPQPASSRSVAPMAATPMPAAPVSIPVPGREARLEAPAADASMPYEAQCDICGTAVRLSFRPDGVRPVYCKNCLKKIRAGELPRLEPKQKERTSAPKAEPPKKPAPAQDFTLEPIDTGPAISLSQALSRGAQKFKG